MRGHQSLIYKNGCTCKGKIAKGREAPKMIPNMNKQKLM
jgi:hypothetical protein